MPTTTTARRARSRGRAWCRSAGRPGRDGPPRAPLLRGGLRGSPTLSQVSILAKFFSPMPLTFIRSCVERKEPDFCRYSTMRAASFGPTPGSVVSCSTVAVLMLTFPVGAGLPAASAGPETRGRRSRGRGRWRRCGGASWHSSSCAAFPTLAARRRPGGDVRPRGPPSGFAEASRRPEPSLPPALRAPCRRTTPTRGNGGAGRRHDVQAAVRRGLRRGRGRGRGAADVNARLTSRGRDAARRRRCSGR